jgi:hypothetical protein
MVATGQKEKTMIVCVTQCAYCQSPILSGERWVREKIYDPTPNGRDPRYHRYHAEPFAGEEASCWEKHQTEALIRQTNRHAA